MTATYASLSHVEARVGGRGFQVPFTSSTKPTDTQVQAWLDDAQEMLDTALAGAGLPAPYSATGPVARLREVIVSYVEGLVRAHHAAAGGDGTNDDGQPLITEFKFVLDDILANPGKWQMALGGNVGPNTRGPSSYQYRNNDSRSIAGGDFAPVFKRGEQF